MRNSTIWADIVRNRQLMSTMNGFTNLNVVGERTVEWSLGATLSDLKKD